MEIDIFDQFSRFHLWKIREQSDIGRRDVILGLTYFVQVGGDKESDRDQPKPESFNKDLTNSLTVKGDRG